MRLLFRRSPRERVPIRRRAFSLPSLVSLVLAALFLVFLVTRFDVDLGAVFGQVRNSNPWQLALAVAVHYTTFLFRGARWRLLLRNTQSGPAPLPGVLYCSQLVLLGWFANSVAWFRLGDAYRAYLYREDQGASFSRAAGTILAERVLDALLVALLLLVAAPFVFSGAQRATGSLLGIAVTLVAILLAVLMGLTWAKQRALRVLPDWLAGGYQSFQEGALGSFRRVPPVTLLGLLGWSSEVARLYLVAQSLGMGFGLPLAIVLALANSLLTLVPTPGGFGAVESGVTGLVVRLSSVSTNAAAALVVVDRSITYVSVIAVGAALFLARQAFPKSTQDRRGPVALPGNEEASQ